MLGALAEGASHGFALAQLLAPDGPLGRIWSLPRPAVYHVIKRLVGMGLVAEKTTEPGVRGPARTIVAITPAGRRAVRRWLEEPVDHVRDVRSLLLLKLALLDRAGADPGRLVAAQREKLARQVASLEAAAERAAGFERVLLQWRLSSSRATLDFLDQIAQ